MVRQAVYQMCRTPAECDARSLDASSADPLEPEPSRERDLSASAPSAGACAGVSAALAQIKMVAEERLMENAACMGSRLKQQLVRLQAKHEVIGDVRGQGLLMGVELVVCRRSKAPVREAVTEQVLARLKGVHKVRGVAVMSRVRAWNAEV
jgi:taurine-pyruvate aminotransferase